VAGGVIGAAGADGEHTGQGLWPGAGAELAEALPLLRGPGAGAQGLVDGVGSVAGGGAGQLPVVVVDQG
jgi:hypothetical protein